MDEQFMGCFKKLGGGQDKIEDGRTSQVLDSMMMTHKKSELRQDRRTNTRAGVSNGVGNKRKHENEIRRRKVKKKTI